LIATSLPRSSGLNRGFTLIELMFAVTILGLILVMLAGSFHAVATGKVHAETRLVSDQQGRTLITEICDEIRGAVQTPGIPSHVTVIGAARMENRVPLDSIAISTLDPGHRRSIEGFGPEDTVSYATAPNPNHRGWYLLIRNQSSSLLVSGIGNIDSSVILADSLLSLHFRYFDGNIWTESWNSATFPPGRGLPLAIAINLELAARNGAPLRLSTIVTLPMAFAQW
jgi:prepilin-type N-terminal cleavage/methylation domain-containing protein